MVISWKSNSGQLFLSKSSRAPVDGTADHPGEGGSRWTFYAVGGQGESGILFLQQAPTYLFCPSRGSGAWFQGPAERACDERKEGETETPRQGVGGCRAFSLCSREEKE